MMFKILAQQLRISLLYFIKLSRGKYCLSYSKRLFTFVSKQLELESELRAGAKHLLSKYARAYLRNCVSGFHEDFRRTPSSILF